MFGKVLYGNRDVFFGPTVMSIPASDKKPVLMRYPANGAIPSNIYVSTFTVTYFFNFTVYFIIMFLRD